MVKLTRQYVQDHMIGTHTEESWARAVSELVLNAAMKQLGDKEAEKITIDAQFVITPVEVDIPGRDGVMLQRLCLRECVVISPTGNEVCYHKEMIE